MTKHLITFMIINFLQYFKIHFMISLSIQLNDFVMSSFQIVQTTLKKRMMTASKFRAKITVKVSMSS